MQAYVPGARVRRTFGQEHVRCCAVGCGGLPAMLGCGLWGVASALNVLLWLLDLWRDGSEHVAVAVVMLC